MLTSEQINDLHRMYWEESLSIRQIERRLNMGWRTIKKYLEAPAQGPATRQRASKLDTFKPVIAEWLEKDASVTSAVIEQRLRPLGYTGGHSILREYVRQMRPHLKPQKRAFVRMEPPPGNASKSIGDTSAHWNMPAMRANSTPSFWWKHTAACCMSSSPIAKASKPSRVVMGTPSMRSAA